MISMTTRLALCVALFVTAVNTQGGSLSKKRAFQGKVTIEEYDPATLKGRASSASKGPVTLSGFITLAHKVSSGKVTIKDSRTITIKSFNYDGAGPDAYFIVGKGEPNHRGRKIPNENGSYEVLEGYEKKDIELLLPQDLTWKDVDYLAVYCVSFRHNFGYIKIPKDINVPEYE